MTTKQEKGLCGEVTRQGMPATPGGWKRQERRENLFLCPGLKETPPSRLQVFSKQSANRSRGVTWAADQPAAPQRLQDPLLGGSDFVELPTDSGKQFPF